MPHYHNLRANFGGPASRKDTHSAPTNQAPHPLDHRNSHTPIGVVTRGTTGINRLRKSDRWTVSQLYIQSLLRHGTPIAVDVGYGASHTTTCEWARWLRTINPSTQVIGLEIEPSRVLPPQEGVTFALGGFELAGIRAHLIRAFNVLRQYDVADVHQAWKTMQKQLLPGGIIIEGTCDELGRRCTWITLDAHGPRSLTLSWDPHNMAMPSDIAERLPKVLIHNNIPGQRIYNVLQELDRAWNNSAPLAPFGPRIRWRETVRIFASITGLPSLIQRRRYQDNHITLPWELVAP